MVDVRLINIIPTSQTVQNVQQATVTQGGSQTAISLPVGSTLSGFIINRDSAGNPILRTQNGDVLFESNLFLKIGSEVSIRIQNTGGSTLARILSINGQPPEIALAQPSSLTDTPDDVLLNAMGTSRTAAANPVNISASSTPAATVAPSAIISANSTLNVSPSSLTAVLLSDAPPAATTWGNTNVVPAGSQLTLRLLALNPQTPGQQPGQNTQATATPVVSGATLAAQTPTNVTGNPQLYAVYARAAGVPLTTTARSTNTTPAAPTAGTISTLDTPEIVQPTTLNNTAANTVATQAAGTQQQLPATPVLPSANNAVPVIAASPVPVKTDPLADVDPLAVTPSPAATTIATNTTNHEDSPPLPYYRPPQQGQVVVGVVIGHEPTGEALLQTPVGVLRLPPGTNLATGSQLTVEIDTINPPAQALPAATLTGATAAPITELSQQWSSLQHIFQLLAGRLGTSDMGVIFPQMAILGENAPSTAATRPDFSSGLLFFASALKGGNIRDWLGRDNTQWLDDNGHGQLLQKASSEFSAMAQQFTRPPEGHWQSLFFPVAVENELQQMRLFVKRERKNSEQSASRAVNPEDDTRFVLEMELSQLGQMQMDGFVKRQQSQMQFDLVVRSHTALPKEVEQDILEIYQSTGELTGYKGTIQFQTVKAFPVNPMEELAAAHLSTLMA